MPTPTDYLKKGALRAIEPAISFLARNNVSPNALTTVGTLLTLAAAVVSDRPHHDSRLDHVGDGLFRCRGWRSGEKNGALDGLRCVLRFNAGPRRRWRFDGGLYCVLRDQSHPPQHLHGRRVPGRNNRDFSGLLHARPRRIARNRCQGWSYAAS